MPPESPTLSEDLRALYASEVDYVYSALRRLGVRAVDLEDAVHDVFLVALRRYPDFRRDRPVRPWLFGIAFRVAADLRRGKGRAVVLEDDQSAHRDPGPGPEESLEAQRRQQILAQVLETLSFERRAVFVMHELFGHDAPEIAEALGTPLNTVYSRLRLARRDFSDAVRRFQSTAGATP